MAGETGERGSDEFANLTPVDPIEALEAELMQARGAGASVPVPPSGEAGAPPAAKTPEALSRGAANFQAWCETRRQLDGMEATFEVEFVDPGGQRRVVDLLKLSFDELPAPIRAEFELRKFPDFASLVPPSTDAHATTAKDRATEERDAEAPAAEGTERRWPAARGARPEKIAPHADASAADEDKPERMRTSPPPAAVGGGFGINLGGVMEGTGRAAASALTRLRERVKAFADPERDPVMQGVQRWREHRARSALATLEASMARVAATLEAARRHAELKESFRTWEVLKTDEGRAKARARFHERLTAGAWNEEARVLVVNLFADVAALREQSEHALKRVHKAGQDTGPVKERLGTWLQRLRAEAGPITNAAGESLGDTFKALAEAVRQVLESLAQRIAHFAAPRPT